MAVKSETEQAALPLDGRKINDKPPNFRGLLTKPAIKLPLPSDFLLDDEASHLDELYRNVRGLHQYEFKEFIHAGGSGLVFRVTETGSTSHWAMKIARRKMFIAKSGDGTAAATSTQSPFSDTEISALEQVSHPNLVCLRNRIDGRDGVVALVTTYVDRPQPLDEYLRATLSRDPDPKKIKGISPFSPQRLENACIFLVQRCREIASALAHMHEKGIYHCDVKPANILIGHQKKDAILTDLGSSISWAPIARHTAEYPIRVRFTWTYAHPELKDLGKDVRGISGGGLKVSVDVDPKKGLERFDLFAFGRTIQEALAALVEEFGERCYASYGFRFLHLIACLLLDGKNAPIEGRVTKYDNRTFVSDIAIGYPVALFARYKIRTAWELCERLDRFSRDYSWNGRIRELDAWQPDYVNTGNGRIAPFTERVAGVLKHPAIRRLREELQLGWVRDVYPSATHTRWSHTLGVLANVVEYYNALLADPELPTVRILINETDIEHGLVACMLHDIGQTAFGHDLEVISKDIFSHEDLIPRLLDDTEFGPETLRHTIQRLWPNISIERVFSILNISNKQENRSESSHMYEDNPVDGLIWDMIDGPIDADKLDYLVRDSVSCGVPYGLGIDRSRFIKSLTVAAKEIDFSKTRLALAYRAKGAAAIESLLLARYQMYGAVYWHHTFRCIQAMFVHAASKTFEPTLSTGDVKLEGIKSNFYNRVVCRRPVRTRGAISRSKASQGKYADIPPRDVLSEPALAYVWWYGDAGTRELIERIAKREVYKRVYEIRTSELGSRADYSELKEKLSPRNRVKIAEALVSVFLNAIQKKISTKPGLRESVSENHARDSAQALQNSKLSLVVIDYPIRGVPDEKNIPNEIGDASRKYISGHIQDSHDGREVFNKVRRLQIEIATLRVFAEQRLHELIIRYLDPNEVRSCVNSAMPFLRTHK